MKKGFTINTVYPIVHDQLGEIAGKTPQYFHTAGYLQLH